jgi:hypothetical protein
MLNCANAVLAKNESLSELSVRQGDRTYSFQCENADGVSAINVTLLDASGGRQLLKHTLDEFDDCRYATWLTENVGRAPEKLWY